MQSFWGALIERIADEEGLAKPLTTPEGVVGRKIAEHQYFYVNTLNKTVEVPLPEEGWGVLKGGVCQWTMLLEPLDGELLVSGRQEEMKEWIPKT